MGLVLSSRRWHRGSFRASRRTSAFAVARSIGIPSRDSLGPDGIGVAAVPVVGDPCRTPLAGAARVAASPCGA
jgi:hypothetical protein